MNEHLIQVAHEIIHSPKTAATTSGLTVSTGVSTYLDLIPSNIGWIAALIGATLSAVLIVTAIRREIRESKQHELKDVEIQLLRAQLAKLAET